MAEDRPRCTVCGVRVAQAGVVLVHVEHGRTFRHAREPVGHDATVDPRFLVALLRLW